MENDTSQLQDLMAQLGDNLQQEAMGHRADTLTTVLAFNPEELTDVLYRSMDKLELVIDGFGMAKNLDASLGVALVTLMDAHDSLESAVAWIESKFFVTESGNDDLVEPEVDGEL